MKWKSTPHLFLQPLERCVCDPVETFLTLARLHPRQLRNFSSPKAKQAIPWLSRVICPAFCGPAICLGFIFYEFCWGSTEFSASGSHSALETGCYSMLLDSGTQNCGMERAQRAKGLPCKREDRVWISSTLVKSWLRHWGSRKGELKGLATQSL